LSNKNVIWHPSGNKPYLDRDELLNILNTSSNNLDDVYVMVNCNKKLINEIICNHNKIILKYEY